MLGRRSLQPDFQLLDEELEKTLSSIQATNMIEPGMLTLHTH